MPSTTASRSAAGQAGHPAPNHGDAEVQEDLEKFPVARAKNFQRWIVIEIGNCYGFDDWSFGARERIALYLKKLGKPEEELPGVGIDTLPSIDWSTVDRWCNLLCNYGG